MADDVNDPSSVRWLTPAEREAWMALGALAWRLPTLIGAQLEADADLSFFEYTVMAVLSEQPGHALQMRVLADALAVSLSRLSHTVTRLEKNGYAHREATSGRGRSTNAILTPAGFAKVVATAPGHVEHVRRLVIDTNSAEDLAALARIGRNILGNDFAELSRPAD